MITLLLDEEVIAGYGHKVTCELALPDEDLSGQSSSSAAAEGGIKPKRLRVQLNVRYEDRDDLAALVLLASATNDDGSRKKYKIVNDTATAFNIRQVRFTERFNAQELDETQAWSVTFVLVEIVSVPEKVEQKRIETAEPNVPIADQKTAGAASESAPTTGVEKIVAWLDRKLADEGEVNEI